MVRSSAQTSVEVQDAVIRIWVAREECDGVCHLVGRAEALERYLFKNLVPVREVLFL